MCHMKTFSEWLQNELRKRGWGPAELAKKMGTYPATVSNVLNGMRNPGPEFCRALARALGYPQEYVFRKAGLIDDTPPPEYDPDAELLLHWFRSLPPEERKEILEYVQFKLSRHQTQAAQKRRSRAKNPAPSA